MLYICIYRYRESDYLAKESYGGDLQRWNVRGKRRATCSQIHGLQVCNCRLVFCFFVLFLEGEPLFATWQILVTDLTCSVFLEEQKLQQIGNFKIITKVQKEIRILDLNARIRRKIVWDILL